MQFNQQVAKYKERVTNDHLSSSFVVFSVSSASVICSSKLFILVSKMSGVSAPKIIDDNPLNENPPDLGGVWPLSMACYSTAKQNSQEITKNTLCLLLLSKNKQTLKWLFILAIHLRFCDNSGGPQWSPWDPVQGSPQICTSQPHEPSS